MTPAEQLEYLRDPRNTLPNLGKVLDQSTSEMVQWTLDISPRLQHAILDHIADPPRMPEGHKKWLVLVSSRQSTKSVTTSGGIYVDTAYNPGRYSITMTYPQDRADDLFRATSMLHASIPDEVRMPTKNTREIKQITFEHLGLYKTQTTGAHAVGLGRAYDNFHLSEAPFIEGIGSKWSLIQPAIINRAEANVIIESTPATMDMPGTEWFKETFDGARMNPDSRFYALFFPFFESRLCEREWKKEWKVTNEELTLLEKFGPKGNQPVSAPGALYLTLENLAFRREVPETDAKVRRNPELFNVWYPFDPITCWQHVGGSAIPAHILSRHLGGVLAPWSPNNGCYQEYAAPKPGAVYVLGVDPAGYGTGDQAAFQVLEVWEDRWEQVAEFSTNTMDPNEVARWIMITAHRYNDATVIVESNGVGTGTLELLRLAFINRGIKLHDESGVERLYPMKNLYFHRLTTTGESRPGIPAGKEINKQAFAWLLDALMGPLVLHSEHTLSQLTTYKQDKLVAPGEIQQILNPGETPRKRQPKHHWDRVSALIWACYAARFAPVRHRQLTREEHLAAVAKLEEEHVKGYTRQEMQRYRYLNRNHPDYGVNRRKRR